MYIQVVQRLKYFMQNINMNYYAECSVLVLLAMAGLGNPITWICTDCGEDQGSANALTMHRYHKKCVRDAASMLQTSIGAIPSMEEATHHKELASLRQDLLVDC